MSGKFKKKRLKKKPKKVKAWSDRKTKLKWIGGVDDNTRTGC